MSGLEKFEASDAWRQNIKNLLLMDRQFKPQATAIVKQDQRFSLDIAEDFRSILEEKKIPKPDIMDNEKNDEDQQRGRVASNDTMCAVADDTQALKDISDESFEALEKMCDKTASDPDSTLFHYLHSDAKGEIIAAVKLRQAQPPRKYDSEFGALQRLLIEMSAEEKTLLENESPLKCVADDTQLDDIEAPSRFWETIIGGETSPVKMVGLLRPSTILEEFDDESGTSGLTSFLSATQAQCSEVSSSTSKPCSDISTSCYETANETAKTSTTTPSQFEWRPEAQRNEDLNASGKDLIDLDASMRCEQAMDSSGSADMNESLLILISDDEIDDETTQLGCKPLDSVIKSEAGFLRPLTAEPAALQSMETSSTNTEAVDSESLQSGDSFSLTSVENDDVENKENTSNISLDGSMHFNDTMEKVDYMMRKGLEYMAAANVSSQPPELTTPIAVQKQNTFTLQSSKQRTPVNAASPLKRYPMVKLPNRFAIDIKPIPSLNLFKKPIGAVSRIPQPHQQHRDQFAHIRSPVGAYIKKTTTTPLMVRHHCTNTNKSFHNATVFRELELGTRQEHQQRQLFSDGVDAHENIDPFAVKSPIKHPFILPANKCPLPRKRYVASQYKQYIDDRTQITIPGGPSIQKYLDSAVLPTVMRHEGKVKLDQMMDHGQGITGNDVGTSTRTPAPRLTDSSLGDLSTMSGEISVYTIKDAQKF